MIVQSEILNTFLEKKERGRGINSYGEELIYAHWFNKKSMFRTIFKWGKVRKVNCVPRIKSSIYQCNKLLKTVANRLVNFLVNFSFNFIKIFLLKFCVSPWRCCRSSVILYLFIYIFFFGKLVNLENFLDLSSLLIESSV